MSLNALAGMWVVLADGTKGRIAHEVTPMAVLLSLGDPEQRDDVPWIIVPFPDLKDARFYHDRAIWLRAERLDPGHTVETPSDALVNAVQGGPSKAPKGARPK